MTQMVEFDLAKVLEDIRQDIKETNRKLDNLSEGQIRLEGKVDTLSVEVQNSKEEIKDIKSDIKGRISIQTYWFLLLISLLVGIVGKFAFFPKA